MSVIRWSGLFIGTSALDNIGTSVKNVIYPNLIGALVQKNVEAIREANYIRVPDIFRWLYALLKLSSHFDRDAGAALRIRPETSPAEEMPDLARLAIFQLK